MVDAALGSLTGVFLKAEGGHGSNAASAAVVILNNWVFLNTKQIGQIIKL